MKNTHRYGAAAVMAGALFIAIILLSSTSLAFAKNDDSKGKNENKDKKEVAAKNDGDKNAKKPEKGSNINFGQCWKAYGHFFAPGWLKKNPAQTLDANCYLPFGIGKKFKGDNGNATTTPTSSDTTAPVISNLVLNAAKNQVGIRWTTDERSDSAAFVSASSPVSTSGTPSALRTERVRDHRLVVKNLNASTTYYVIVRSRDAAGNTSYSTTSTFTTQKPTTDTNAPVISNIVTVTGTTTIQVAWKTGEFSTSRVYYGTTTPLSVGDSGTSSTDNNNLVQSHVLNISGLVASTTYYLRVESTDSVGNVTLSPQFSAMTTPGTTTPPVADTLAPVISSFISNVGTSTAVIGWTTNEQATSKVYFSTSTPLDMASSTTSIVSNGSLNTNHLFSIGGLATSTAHYFIVESKDNSGNIATSSQFTLTTAAN